MSDERTRGVRDEETPSAGSERGESASAQRAASAERRTNERRERRVPLNAPVQISTIDSETDPGTGRSFFRSSKEVCANVSRTGLFIRTAEPLEPGRRLLVELELPDGAGIDAVGRVAWVKRSLAPGADRGVGIELLGATADELAALQAFVSTQKPKRRKRRSGGNSSSS